MSEASDLRAAQEAAAPRPSPRLVRLWLGLLLPPAGWIADFLARYLVTRFTSIHHLRWPLRLSSVLGVALTALGAALCAGLRRDAGGMPPSERELPRLAAWGLALAAFFLLLILAEAFPTFVLDPREIT
jgi:hypothetical protein